jgi:hypothetical protein
MKTTKMDEFTKVAIKFLVVLGILDLLALFVLVMINLVSKSA